MKVYNIYKVNDTYTKHDYCATVTARNEVVALRNYAKGLMNSGTKEIIYNDFRHEHELMTSYGACFVATERK